MGFEPVLITPTSAADAVRQVYYYIESGIPVVLSLTYPDEKAHAVTVVGHNIKAQPSYVTETRQIQHEEGTVSERKFCRSSDLVGYFLVQDDDGGPYRRVYFRDSDGSSCTATLFGTHESAREEILALSAILVPFPTGVLIDGEAAEDRAMSFVSSVSVLLDQPLPDPTLARTFLQLSNLYKHQWDPHEGRPTSVGRHARCHLLSKWVWITELADAKTWADAGRVLGEVVQDGASYAIQIDTGHATDFLLWHMPTYMNVIDTLGNIEGIEGVAYRDYRRLARLDQRRA
jgi:hypothetical protein